ncbi:hypothetical protein DSO57_1010191 [Entomophthora muscae]|uniref:Uncharacterized protein n=1 Tax=Entomophthora muscae TaxID=34485 RepID=A0ACC2URD2_9FUNG|nr:hypothetical protein DSO57_1010191 [Entomophthora muscae]
MAQYTYNSQHQASTGMSPFYANYRFDPTWDHLDLGEASNPNGKSWIRAIHQAQQDCVNNLVKAVNTYKDYADKKRKPGPLIEVGDQVYLDALWGSCPPVPKVYPGL